MVEIAKALSIDARIIIMDEPTSSLTLTETETAAAGDRRAEGGRRRRSSTSPTAWARSRPAPTAWSCLRDGRLVGALDRDEIHHDRMVRMMVGRDLKALYIPPAVAAQPGAAARSAACVTAAFPDHEVTLSVRPRRDPGPGRAGRLRPHLAGARHVRHRPDAGRRGPAGWQAAHHRHAARGDRPGACTWCRRTASAAAWCWTCPSPRTSPCAGLGAYAERWLIDRARRDQGRPRPSASSCASGRRRSTPTALTLSGGNQQKVVLAKWLAHAAARPDLRRADARHRRRRQVRDLPADARAGRPRRRRS